MLKVVVSEKGGPEREYTFEGDKDISIGRLQGNLIVLPKPNVSKRHATIVYRDGKVTIIDQRSTNGTYVNGRRITEPRKLDPGDRIYIGDFILKAAEAGDERIAADGEVSNDTRVEDANPVPIPPPVPDESSGEERAATVAMPSMPAQDELSSDTPLPIDLDVEIVTDEVVDTDSIPDRPAPVPEPVPPELIEEAVEAVSRSDGTGRAHESEAAPGPPQVVIDEVPDDLSLSKVADELSGREASRPAQTTATKAAGLSSRLPKVTKGKTGEAGKDAQVLRTVAQAAHAEVFASIPPVKSDFTDEEWKDISDRVLRLVDRMRRDNLVPADVDPYALSQDILFEFTGLGPLEELLADEEVRRVLVDGIDRIFVVRGSVRERSGRVFADQDTMERIVAKLLVLSGNPDAGKRAYVEGRLPDGTQMIVLRPPLVSDGIAMVFEKPTGSNLTPQDLVDAEVITAKDAAIINRTIQGRGNVMICGPRGSGQAVFMNAICRMIPGGSRVVALERQRRITLDHVDVVNIDLDRLADPEGPGPCLVGRLQPDVTLVTDIEAEDARLLTSLCLTGHRGLIASTVASSVDSCLSRLELLLAFAHPTLDRTILHTMIRSMIDLVVVLGTDEKGRSKVEEVVVID